jgi:alkaline phosphatase
MPTPRPLADARPDHAFPGASIDRRTLLKSTAAIAALASLDGLRQRTLARTRDDAAPAERPTTPRAKNVIFMVSDGMSTGTLTLADIWLRKHAGNPSRWASLWSQPGVRRATARTHSADSLVTDSAAGGCAWGAGVHIDNGCINVTRDGRQLMPILIRARQARKATGLVTTARITHATPASFFANVTRRDYEGMIAAQLLERGLDVALGGGARFFPESETSRHPEVHIVKTAPELRSAPKDGRLLGIFDSDHVPYVLDRDDSIPGLVEMTRTALARLENNPEGFVLQVEGGRIDHAAHNNDACSLIREQVEFDAAIGAVLEWVAAASRRRDETLIILTSDHGNANPGLTLYGEQAEAGFEFLAQGKKSFEWVAAQMQGAIAATDRRDKMAAAVKSAFGYDLAPDERELMADCLQDRRAMAFFEANKWTSVLGAILADRCGVAFVSPNHTSDYVEVTALGPGSESVAAGVIDNIDLHGVMVEALALPEGKLLPDMQEPLRMPKPPKPD